MPLISQASLSLTAQNVGCEGFSVIVFHNLQSRFLKVICISKPKGTFKKYVTIIPWQKNRGTINRLNNFVSWSLGYVKYLKTCKMCLKQLLAYSTKCSCERLMKEMVTLVMGFSVSFETKGFILNITEHDFFVHVT